MLGFVRHRAVVRVDDLVELESGPAIVMELVEGIDLRGIIGLGPSPPQIAFEVGEEVAGALHAAWTTVPPRSTSPLRLVHRDVKPAPWRLLCSVRLVPFGQRRHGERE